MTGRQLIIGTVGGCLVGILWAVLGSGGYETGDVVIGMSVTGAITGLLVTLLASVVASAFRRRRD